MVWWSAFSLKVDSAFAVAFDEDEELEAVVGISIFKAGYPIKPASTESRRKSIG